MHPLRFSLVAFAIWAATNPIQARPVDSLTSPQLSFWIERGDTPNRVRLKLRGQHTNVSADYSPPALVGLDTAQLRTSGAPIRFAINAASGRIDCTGRSRDEAAAGTCDFAPDPAFGDFLVAHGIARPSNEQALQLAITGVMRELVQALAEANIPAPSPDELAGMAAIGVTGDYVDGLARNGYRRLDSDQVVQFRALGITPDYLRELAAAGYPSLSAEDVTSLRAIGMTCGYIEALSQAGYRHVPVERLIEMRALGTRREALEMTAQRDASEQTGHGQ